VFAIKRQHLKDPDDLTDKAYRELRILLQLSKLQRHHVCANFVFLRDWHKSTPPLMFPTKQDYGPNDQVRWKIVYFHLIIIFSHRSARAAQFLNFELEYADHSLPALKEVTLLEFKVILFQIIYALYVAQRYFKLVHNDLHSKNILLQEMDPRSPYMAFHDLDRIWYGRKYIVKITDFGTYFIFKLRRYPLAILPFVVFCLSY
jgi:serine/threonine protein kinase